MALKDKWYTLSFSSGLDTEIDKKKQIPGTLTDLENGVMTERVTIVKRPGTRLLNRRLATSVGYASISGALGLSSRLDEQDLVMLTSDDKVCSYDESNDSWIHRGDWLSLRQELESPPRGPNEAWDVTQCTSGSVQLWAWEDKRGGIYARFRNIDTGVAYTTDFKVGGHTGRQPTALTVGHKMHVYFTSGTVNTMNVAVLNPANPTSTSASFVQLHPALATANPYYCVDTLPSWNTSRIAINISGSTYIAVIKEDGPIGVSGSSPSWPNPITFDRSVINPDLTLSADGLKMAVTVKGDQTSGGSVYARVYNPVTFQIVTGTIRLDTATSVTASDITVDRIAAGFHGVSGSQYLTAYSSMSASVPSLRRIRSGQTTVTSLPYPVATSSSFIRHTSLVARPFRLGDRSYFWGVQESPLQTTDFMIRDDGQVMSTSRYSLAYPIQSGVLGRVEVRAEDGNPVVVRRGVTTRDQFVAVSGGFINDNGTTTNRLSSYGDRHPELLSLTYHPSASWRPVDVAGNMYMPGGFLGKYDGTAVTENNFLLQTENLTVSLGSASLAAGLGILSSGSVFASGPAATASFVWEVIPVAYDAQGNKEFGACAQIVQAFPTGALGAVQNTASLTWNTIAHTRRNGINASDIRFEVYRTGWNVVGGLGVPTTTRQRIDNPAYPVVNQTGSDTVTFNDTVPTSVQSLGGVCYTNFEPANVPTPPVAFMAPQGDRLYLAGIEGGQLIVLPSKLRLDGAIAFADGQSLSVDSAGGPITALAAMDEKVIIFKDRKIFVTTADGPDNTLLDTTPFRNPELVSSDVGAPEPATVVQVAGTTVQGLIFRSNRGYRSIGRGIDLIDIGAKVRRFDDLKVVGGLSPSNAEECRFYTSDGTSVVLNTRYNEWSTFQEQVAVGASNWKGIPTFVGSDGRVRVEDSENWLDNSIPYPLRLTTGWLPIQELQGYTRVRRLFLLGDFHSHHKLRIEMATDYRDSWRPVCADIDTRTALGVTYYGGPQTAISSSVGFTAYSDTLFRGIYNGPTVKFAVTGSSGNGYQLNFQNAITGSQRLVETATRSTFMFSTSGTIGDYEAIVQASSSYLQIASASLDPTINWIDSDSEDSFLLAGGINGSSNAPAGSTATYGSGSYGGKDMVYQFDVQLPIQRMETLRLRFTDVDQATSGSIEDGRSFSLTEVKLLVATDTKAELPGRKRH